jgi:thioredoxin
MKKTLISLSFLLLFSCVIKAQALLPQQQTESTAAQPAKAEESKFVIHIDKAGFLKNVYNYEKNPGNWVYEGKLPCIVDFYAQWCGPCRMIAPSLEELAKEYKGRIVIYKVDTQVNPELSQYFNIRSIPTLFYCPVGAAPQAITGGYPKEKFKEMIEAILLNNNQQPVQPAK